jgi:hypothetical protein
MANNNIIINQEVSLPYPFGTHKAFPLDSRSFFSSYEDALEAVHDAVQLKRVGDMFVLPSEEDGGADSVYYYGEPIAVSSMDGEKADLYLIVKEYDEDGEPFGTLRGVCAGLDENYLRKEEAAEFIEAYIERYIRENLNTDCINDYLFTNAIDECGNRIPSTGLYSFGFKEVEGLMQLCDEAKQVLWFDPSTPYDKATNPLATLASVNKSVSALGDELREVINCLKRQVKKKVDKIPGYGLSENNFSNCLMDKLMNMPDISVDGNRLTINGTSFKLEPWNDIFDYYIGWMNLENSSRFLLLSKDELFKHIKNTGNVPPEGALYGPDSACGFNTFFVIKRKHLSIDDSYKGEYSELQSHSLSSPIRTYIPSVMHHYDVLIDNAAYDVYGLHTYRPNSSDRIQIAFNIDVYDYYVGWLNLNIREHFFSLSKDTLLQNVKASGNVPVEGTMYGPDKSSRYNTFFVMKRKGISIDSSYLGNYSELHSNGVSSPIRTYISSIMHHTDASLNGVLYDVYGLFTYRQNPNDEIQIAFNRNMFDYYIGFMNLNRKEDFYNKSPYDFTNMATYGMLDDEFVYEEYYRGNNLFYVMVRDGVTFGDSWLTSGNMCHTLTSPISERGSSVIRRDDIFMDGAYYKVYGVHSYRANESDFVHIAISK